MRVLHVISSIDYTCGGPTRALVGLTAAQVKVGMDVAVISTARAGEAASAAPDLRAAGVRVEVLGPATGKLLRHPALVPVLGRGVAEADVVHVHALWEEIQHQACLLARRRGVPYLVRPCGMLDPWALAQSKWKKRLYLWWRLRRDLRHAAALHFTAETERDRARGLGLEVPTIVEPNGIDLAEFAEPPPAQTFRDKHPQIGSRRIVLFLSRLHLKKGLDLLIPAFAATRNDAMLVIAGPGSEEYRQQIEAMVDLHDVRDRVLFTGMLLGRERIKALAAADLFVLPSRQENFGIAVVEALAAGTPVIISDQVNIQREIMAAGVGAVVPLDVKRLTEELERWLKDDPLRQSAAQKARPFAMEAYDWDKIAARWKQHYQRLTRPSLD